MRPVRVVPVKRALACWRRHVDRANAGQEAGFGIVEIIAAFSIVFVGFFALANATGSASRRLVKGGQRQIATAEATARLEDMRNLSYAGVALKTQPSHSVDPESPEYFVSADGTSFDAQHNGTLEELIVDAAAGQVTHIESGVRVGSTALDLFKYVTWVDDPAISGAQNYRRVTIIARYFLGGDVTRPRTVQVAALLTPGTITIGGSTAAPTSGSATPTATAQPTPTGSCAGDVSAPTGDFIFLSGTGAQTGYTASTTATLSLSPSDPCAPISYRISNDGASYSAWVTYDASASTVSWSLTSGDGSKTVWVQYEDAASNRITAPTRTVTLDTVTPTVPGTLTRTVSCNGNDRTVNLSWGVATDTNWLGYRIQKSVNGGAYVLLGSVATTGSSDTDSKGLSSLSYRVVAYDKAGNEGSPTNVITLSKNQCT